MRSALARAYEVLATLILPRAFHREYGEEMAQAVRARLLAPARRKGVRAVGLTFLREVVDLLVTAARERVQGREAGLGESPVGSLAKAGAGDVTGSLAKDLSYAVRSLGRHPGFTGVVVASLALGIGGNTVMYAVVDGVLLRSMPYQEADRLAWVWSTDPQAPGSSRGWVSYPDYQDMRRGESSFEALTGFRATRAILTSPDAEPVAIPSLSADASFPEVYRARPVLGRWFTAEEDRVGGPPTVVLAHELWRQRFGADPGVLGRTAEIDGRPHEIVGVMPPDFDAPRDARIFRALAPDAGQDGRGMHRLFVVGRLDAGVRMERASQDVIALAAALREAHPATNGDVGAFAEPLREAFVGGARPALLVLMGAVGLVLLVVCANVANLLLTRSTARERELAVRTALGASRSRLLRQLLSEAGLLAAGGVLLGVGMAYAGLEGLLALAPPSALPRAEDVVLDGRVLAVATAAGLGTTLLFGLLPALGASRIDLRGALARGEASPGGTGSDRLRRGFVVLEVSMAMTLVVGAGLLIRSVERVRALEPGFDPQGLHAVPLSLPVARYPFEEWRVTAELFGRLREEVEGLPGVRSAALAYAHPQDPGWGTAFWLAGSGPVPPPSERPEARYRPVGPGYFEAAGIPIVQGRGVSEADDATSPPVVVVNRAFVRAYLPDRDPLEARIVKETWWQGAPEGEWQVVGVVEDVRFQGAEAGTRPAIYYPHAQRPMNDMYLVFRTDLELAAVAPRIEEAIWRMDADLPVQDLVSLEEALSGSLAGRRFNTLLLGAFAAMALLLAVVGIYGVVSHSVSGRTREMGIRISLGAGRTDLVGLVLRQALALGLAGVVLGGLGAAALGGVTGSLLFGVSATDGWTYAGVAAVLLLASQLAAFVPARRATRIDPVRALRAE